MSVHTYPSGAKYSCGLGEAIGGIGSYLIPLAGGYIQQSYESSAGLHFIGANIALGGAWFILAAIIRPATWRPYEQMKLKE